MKKQFKVGDLVKMKQDRFFIHRWKNTEKLATLPVAGMITAIHIESWIHPYYGLSKHFEKKEIEVEVATIKWFEYEIPGFGFSDEFNLVEYNKNYSKMPIKRLADFSKYLAVLKKKKDLYK